MTLICGHYEGFDERIRQWVTDEISIETLLTGGELSGNGCYRCSDSIVARGLDPASAREDSLYDGLLEYPNTPDLVFHGLEVPEVLPGHHEKIRRWRRKMSLRTWQRRPDLLIRPRRSCSNRTCADR